MLHKKEKLVLWSSVLYLVGAGIFFFQGLNFEFLIYVWVILILMALIFWTLKYTKFPVWMLWMFSFWWLLHILGGSVQTPDGVLFAYRIFPFLDMGWEFYILKYDQVVHFYLYMLVAMMAHHLLSYRFKIHPRDITLILSAILISLWVSSLNEIMEFFISLSLPNNGVGGYENTMLDFIFNFSGALLWIFIIRFLKK